MTNRRTFLKIGALAGTGAALARPFGGARAWAFAQSPTKIRKSVVDLPGVGPTGANRIGQYLALASKQTVKFAAINTDYYAMEAARFNQQMHPDLPGKTYLFGYGDLVTGDRKYLGGTIVAKRGTPTILSVANRLPVKHILPVDPTVMAGSSGGKMLTVGDLLLNRIAVHLHGGFSPWFSDGTPFQWFTPTGMSGPSFMNIPGFASAAGTGTNY